MKISIIALSVAALLAFGADNATAQSTAASASLAASPAVAPAGSPPASPAAAATSKKSATTKKASPAKKSAATKPEVINKPEPAKTPPTASRNKQPGQQKKLADCAAANKGKTGDDYENSFSDCMKASPATDKK